MTASIRQHPPTRHLTRETLPPEWGQRSCATDAHLWDLDADGIPLPGGFVRGERPEERRARHRQAIAGCRACPVLTECAGMDHGDARGVIAGVVRR